MLRVGATEAERERIIAALRAGKTFEDATEPWRKLIEPAWFAANEKHLADVAKNGETKPSPVASPVATTVPEEPRSQKK